MGQHLDHSGGTKRTADSRIEVSRCTAVVACPLQSHRCRPSGIVTFPMIYSIWTLILRWSVGGGGLADRRQGDR
jgi:hypothetical protein